MTDIIVGALTFAAGAFVNVLARWTKFGRTFAFPMMFNSASRQK